MKTLLILSIAFLLGSCSQRTPHNSNTYVTPLNNVYQPPRTYTKPAPTTNVVKKSYRSRSFKPSFRARSFRSSSRRR